ncbi:hypothetical protein M0657_011538 [Pyricularia oryzae]|uniref:Uncharacterized protein n=2 Tax=Pyricularia oryzae TaxID=318829 RepID=A0AA97P1P0_PYRO3|nr:hypothetical protein OOU_Y34scaffold00449g2 [Pyricularia oryzae Y34]KAI7909438.1 hypothetical protein M9X92_011643 [Pyricularia oryzae]KAI7910080.1 hypothetical protein M0657_011538 [Pyricularia oryzae]
MRTDVPADWLRAGRRSDVRADGSFARSLKEILAKAAILRATDGRLFRNLCWD